ncbi:glycoside hydrolase family 76 protein [Microbacterium immunditiarum]|uniref:Putative alpha-1,6-mannanase (GH76 family) n=1 Tax=Microbacterium immunditiarum TaxID=337480 RepID=A0A7Y9GPD2_9MICO|nr:glycoside hydrolase family 76 protein [Microbacterium immunditiarum]NYE19085.1 putative alpha-1,6-mannanase (GH76 family) [Microbacterium immunditiarum]
MTTVQQFTWDERATIAQLSLDHFFGVEGPQLLNNSHPAGDNTTFNYWWLAHLIDARVDAFERTGDPAWLRKAEAVYANILERNQGSLFNDYFDDMLWYALAILRLHDATGEARYLSDAKSIWTHVVDYGWNDQGGASVAWRKQQPYYKNTPANGPFVILSARLSTGDADSRYLDYGVSAYRWLTDTLVGPDGFVEDGINREQNGEVDLHWRFTYNQGLYVGAGVALAQATGDRRYVADATRTALTALRELSDGELFREEGAGGDEGLFKGIYYRYIGTLLDELDPAAEAAVTLEQFVRASTDALWAHSRVGDWLLAGDDWSQPAPVKVDFSTQLSAIMALELRARRERR